MQPQQFITERSKVALGLNPHLRAQMAIYDDNVGLESFMQRASRISQRLTSCYADEATTQLTSLASSPPVPEPMQIDSARLSRTERARRRAAGLCLYCAASDHLIRTCPVRPPCPAVSTIQTQTRCFHIIPSSSTTTYFRILCYSLRPCQLGLLRELHIQSPPNSTQPTPKAAALGAPSRDHSRKAAWAWKG